MAVQRALLALLPLLLLAATPLAVRAAARLVTIDNTAPRLDSAGAILDGHDLTVRGPLSDGSYVMYTNSYGLCVAALPLGCDSTPDRCGFRPDHNVSIYTTPDLSSGSWVFRGLAYEWTARPAGVLYRPDAIFNAATGLWVLWINLNYVYWTSTSPSPFGPFTDHRQSNLTLSVAGNQGGDFHIFLDESASPPVAYVIFSASVNHVARLTADYRDWAPGAPIFDFDEPFSEAPAVLFRGGLFYALFGHCCCFCLQGSGLYVYTAAAPLGPWTRQGSPADFDVSCQPPPPPPPANPFCGLREELGNVNITLECVNGVIDALPVALYGLQTGACPSYAASSTCNDPGFAAFAAAACIGQRSCVLSTDSRPDPCVGTEKSVAVAAHCSLAPGGFSPDGPVAPPPPPENPFCGSKTLEGDFSVSLECVNGVIDALEVALYGVQDGECPRYTPSAGCNDASFASYAAAACVGLQNCTLTTSGRPDPCLGTVKSISVAAYCSLPPGGVSPDAPVWPPPTPPSSSALAAVDARLGGGGPQPTPGQGCDYDGSGVAVTRSQQSAIVTVPDGNGGSTFLYYGDRWGQSPDGIKGHEPQYVFPITFNADGSIPHFTWQDKVQFSIEVASLGEETGA